MLAKILVCNQWQVFVLGQISLVERGQSTSHMVKPLYCSLEGRRLQIYHLDPCPFLLRPCLATRSLLAATAGLGSLSLLPGVLPEKSLGAQWEKPACFLYGFLMTGLRYNFSCWGGGWGRVFLLHPLDWPVTVMGCWFIHPFAVALFYLSRVSFIVFSSSRHFKMKYLNFAKPLIAIGLFAHASKWGQTELLSPFLPLQSNAAGGNFLLTLNLPNKLFYRNHFNFCPGKDSPPRPSRLLSLGSLSLLQEQLTVALFSL